jgi:Putative peptidoglycan binding domain
MTADADDRERLGSVSSGQNGAAALTVFAAPATGAEFNTLGERLVPKACFKVEDLLFDFASSFVKPEIEAHLPQLVQLRLDNKVGALFPPMSIFGHADPVGNDDDNKKLSGRRATVIYAMLVRDVALWEGLFSHPVGADDWGTGAIQTMVSRVQAPIGVDGKAGDETRAAIKAFQAANGLPADGVAGPNTRKVLFRAYMDALCGPALVLDRTTDFLAGDADGAGGKGDRQGCSEFNPRMLFSKQEAAAFERSPDKTGGREENATNRRVMILLFAAGRRVKPGVWPCPRVSEGVAGCKKRFFPNAATRRSFQAARREFDTTKDTFACRFYQLISDDSPCERLLTVPLEITIFVGLSVPASANEELAVLDGQGLQTQSLPPKDVNRGVGLRHFVLGPGKLPNPVELRWRLDGLDVHIAGPCDPLALRNALVSRDLDTSQDLIGLERDQPAVVVAVTAGKELGSPDDQPFGSDGTSASLV